MGVWSLALDKQWNDVKEDHQHCHLTVTYTLDLNL